MYFGASENFGCVFFFFLFLCFRTQYFDVNAYITNVINYSA